MKKIQTIKCNVNDCTYCDNKNRLCNLTEIIISNCSNNKEKEATMCSSYNIRKDY